MAVPSPCCVLCPLYFALLLYLALKWTCLFWDFKVGKTPIFKNYTISFKKLKQFHKYNILLRVQILCSYTEIVNFCNRTITRRRRSGLFWCANFSRWWLKLRISTMTLMNFFRYKIQITDLKIYLTVGWLWTGPLACLSPFPVM